MAGQEKFFANKLNTPDYSGLPGDRVEPIFDVEPAKEGECNSGDSESCESGVVSGSEPVAETGVDSQVGGMSTEEIEASVARRRMEAFEEELRGLDAMAGESERVRNEIDLAKQEIERLNRGVQTNEIRLSEAEPQVLALELKIKDLEKKVSAKWQPDTVLQPNRWQEASETVPVASRTEGVHNLEQQVIPEAEKAEYLERKRAFKEAQKTYMDVLTADHQDKSFVSKVGNTFGLGRKGMSPEVQAAYDAFMEANKNYYEYARETGILDKIDARYNREQREPLSIGPLIADRHIVRPAEQRLEIQSGFMPESLRSLKESILERVEGNKLLSVITGRAAMAVDKVAESIKARPMAGKAVVGGLALVGTLINPPAAIAGLGVGALGKKYFIHRKELERDAQWKEMVHQFDQQQDIDLDQLEQTYFTNTKAVAVSKARTRAAAVGAGITAGVSIDSPNIFNAFGDSSPEVQDLSADRSPGKLSSGRVVDPSTFYVEPASNAVGAPSGGEFTPESQTVPNALEASRMSAEAKRTIMQAQSLAERMGIDFDPSNAEIKTRGNIVTEINGFRVPEDLYSAQERMNIEAARQLSNLMNGTPDTNMVSENGSAYRSADFSDFKSEFPMPQQPSGQVPGPLPDNSQVVIERKVPDPLGAFIDNNVDLTKPVQVVSETVSSEPPSGAEVSVEKFAASGTESLPTIDDFFKQIGEKHTFAPGEKIHVYLQELLGKMPIELRQHYFPNLFETGADGTLYELDHAYFLKKNLPEASELFYSLRPDTLSPAHWQYVGIPSGNPDDLTSAVLDHRRLLEVLTDKNVPVPEFDPIENIAVQEAAKDTAKEAARVAAEELAKMNQVAPATPAEILAERNGNVMNAVLQERTVGYQPKMSPTLEQLVTKPPSGQHIIHHVYQEMLKAFQAGEINIPAERLQYVQSNTTALYGFIERHAKELTDGPIGAFMSGSKGLDISPADWQSLGFSSGRPEVSPGDQIQMGKLIKLILENAAEDINARVIK